MRTFECPKCGWSVHPSFELNPKGKLEACCQGKECQYSDPSLTPSDFMAPAIGGKLGAIEVIERTDAPVTGVVRRPNPTVPSAAHYSTDPLDPIPGIKARRDFLEAEIARLEGYRMEKKKLDKMLSAWRREDARQEAERLVLPSTNESN